MSHTSRRSQKFAKLENVFEAFDLLVKEAAVQFPERGSDADKWEWARVLTLVLFEASKRRDLPAERIVSRSKQVVRRLLEKEKTEAYLGVEFAPLEKE